MQRRIDARLAEQIVVEATKVLPFDINVMDETGSILASTDMTRIGALHRGAQIALGNGRDLEIDKAMARRTPKVKPGVNMPLLVEGEIWGAIGITGDPQEVRQYGKLLQVLAQVILQREALSTQLRRDQRHREDLVLQLLNAAGTYTDDALENLARRFGVDTTARWFVMVCDFAQSKATLDQVMDDVARAQARIGQQLPQCLSARLSHGELVILAPAATSTSATSATSATAAADTDTAREKLFAMERLLEGACQTPFAIAIGVGLSGAAAFHQSWKSAQATLRAGLARPRKLLTRSFSFYDHQLFALMASWSGAWQAEQIARPLQLLRQRQRANGELVTTLKSWYQHGGQPGLAAQALGIHRNTLEQRLRRIEQLCGIDLARTDDYVMLYLALLADSPDS